MIVTSLGFRNNEMIPKQHTGFGEDMSPELILKDIPKETVSLTIVMDDHVIEKAELVGYYDGNEKLKRCQEKWIGMNRISLVATPV